MNNASVFLCGGFGNQCFQIATLLNYAIKTNRKVLLCQKSKWSAGIYWNTVFQLLINSQIDPIIPEISVLPEKEYEEQTTHFTSVLEVGFWFTPLPTKQTSTDIMLRGYFQSCSYFTEIEPLLQKIFQPSIELRSHLDLLWNEITKDVCNKSFVSLHVRRGDYLKLSHIHLNITNQYYHTATNLFPFDTTFVVFSDDIDWCRNEWLNNNNFLFVSEEVKDYEAFYLMSQYCKSGHIIANSTFSWWAAYIDWISSNKNVLVVAPETWFGKDGPMKHSLLVPGWITIQNE